MTRVLSRFVFVVAQHAAPVLLFVTILGTAGCVLTRIAKDPKKDYRFLVTGTVMTEEGVPLQGVDVTLKTTGQVYEAIELVRTRHLSTDNTGRFIFAYISHERGANYTITVQKDGFELESVDGASPPDGNHVIRLKKSASQGSQPQ
jgi:hypothetical protein